MACGAEENVLHDEKFQLCEGFADKVRVRIHKAYLFAKQIHGLELALMNRVDHLVIIESFGRRKLHVPTCFETRADVGVSNRLIAGKKIGHGTVVAGALDVIVPRDLDSYSTRVHMIA